VWQKSLNNLWEQFNDSRTRPAVLGSVPVTATLPPAAFADKYRNYKILVFEGSQSVVLNETNQQISEIGVALADNFLTRLRNNESVVVHMAGASHV
jgi:hypothetical protein